MPASAYPFLPVHPEYPDRDVTGRFAIGNPGPPPGSSAVSRLRAETQRLVVEYFARNHDEVLDKLLKQNPAAFLAIVMQGANEADSRAVLDLDPAAPSPVDLKALAAESAARRAVKAELQDRKDAYAIALQEERAEMQQVEWDDWRAEVDGEGDDDENTGDD